MPDPVMTLPAPSAPHLALSWEQLALPPAPREAGLLLLEWSPPCSTLCQERDLPSPWPLGRPGDVGWWQDACILPAVGTYLLGVEMAVSVRLAALKTLSEGWGEEVPPACSGTTAQHHLWGLLGASIFLGLPSHGAGTTPVHCRLAGPCSLPELPWGFPHPLAKKREGLRLLEATICSSHWWCFVG